LAAESGTIGRPGRREPFQGREERKLIRAAQQGSKEAVSRLYTGHWRAAHRAAYLVVHDATAAEDIAQDAFLAAIGALDRFDRRRPFAPWLHRIVVNRAVDWARREALRRSVADPTPQPDSHIPDAQVGEDMMSALAELPPDQRAVIVLRHLLDYTPGEIARMLELPRGTVNSRLRRALDRLRSTVEVEA
jgi:RNA polymerase sigma-70 factor (ECF subfamily)